jgi:hypothetical protein
MGQLGKKAEGGGSCALFPFLLFLIMFSFSFLFSRLDSNSNMPQIQIGIIQAYASNKIKV